MKEQILVTGGSGFVGVHCVARLLAAGYPVRTTLRNLDRKEEVLSMLSAAGVTDTSGLSFAAADLSSDAGWTQAVQGCAFVQHVASPIALTQPKDENEFILPAVNGALRVLKAAREGGAKRVIMTSSFGAVSYGYHDSDRTFTENDWTNMNDKTLSPYIKSKTLAEKAAWDFIAGEGGGLELSVINPVGIFGPTLSPRLSSAFQVLQKLLDGSMKAAPKISFAVVDVRDVADLHMRAMEADAAKGQRFIAAAEGAPLSLSEMAVILRRVMGEKAAKTPTKELPDMLLRVLALFNPMAKNVVPQLGKLRRADNGKAKALLGWAPGANTAAIAAAAESMLKVGAV